MRSVTFVVVLWLLSFVGWVLADEGSAFEIRCSIVSFAALLAWFPAIEAEGLRRRLDDLEARWSGNARPHDDGGAS